MTVDFSFRRFYNSLRVYRNYFLKKCLTAFSLKWSRFTYKSFFLLWKSEVSLREQHRCIHKHYQLQEDQYLFVLITPPGCLCSIIILFLGETQVRSVSRSCLPQDSNCQGERCCNTDGVYKSCEHKCREDMCNDRNAEEWLHRGGSSGAIEIHSFVASLVVLMTCLTKLLI